MLTKFVNFAARSKSLFSSGDFGQWQQHSVVTVCSI